SSSSCSAWTRTGVRPNRAGRCWRLPRPAAAAPVCSGACAAAGRFRCSRPEYRPLSGERSDPASEPTDSITLTLRAVRPLPPLRLTYRPMTRPIRPIECLSPALAHRITRIRWGAALIALLLVGMRSDRISHGQSAVLATRGIEEVGRSYIGEPLNAYIGHMAMLFVTGKHPTIGNGTMQDTVDWVNDPLHSVIADGTGG